jgi:hypothetical protein
MVKSFDGYLVEGTEEITQKLKRMNACILDPLVLRSRFLPIFAHTSHKIKDGEQNAVVHTFPEGTRETLPSYLQQVKQDFQGTVSDLCPWV